MGTGVINVAKPLTKFKLQLENKDKIGDDHRKYKEIEYLILIRQ